MRKTILATWALLALASCSGPGDITQKQSMIQSIMPGESKEQVSQKLGLPGKVKQKEAGKEEWFYCSTSLGNTDTYYTIEMNKGRVANISQRAAALVVGSCSKAYSLPTQEELIAIDAEKCTAYGLKKGTPAYTDCMMKQDAQRALAQQTESLIKAQEKMQADQQLHEMNMRNLHPEQFDRSINCQTSYYSNGANTTCR